MAGEHQAQRQPSDSRLRRGPRQAGAEVPVSQPTQDQLGRLEVVHPGGQAAKGPQTTSTSVGYSAPAEVPRGTRRPAGTGSRRRRSPARVPRGTRRPAGTGSRRRRSTAGLPGRQGPAPLPAPRRGRQAPRWRPRCSPAAHAATTAAPVGTDLETAGWLPQSRPCDSARMHAQVRLVRWWSSAAASETVIGRLLAQEPATAARLPRAAARLHGLQPNATRRQPSRRRSPGCAARRWPAKAHHPLAFQRRHKHTAARSTVLLRAGPGRLLRSGRDETACQRGIATTHELPCASAD